MSEVSDSKGSENAELRADEERPKPDATAYGSLVDKMAATVAAWPLEYQRSVDVHHLHVQSGNA
jgi:hypothetical protein